ncbi:uncharacterized protein VTP21DRAFT_10085 [Calcarisporiella thermophila]|uniref:uncharacterized protein n=1 Tax=Calcarisporiella thermophila TaxID=911321 RepID=UPI00374417F2
MESQPLFNILENVFGTIGTIFWSFQLLPQIWKNWKNKSSKGLSVMMMILWSLSGVFFGAYAILLDLSIPLIVQPQVFGFLGMICVIQHYYYDCGLSRARSVSLLVGCMAGFGVVEYGFVRLAWLAVGNGAHWMLDVVGSISVSLLTLGFLPQYIDIYREKRVYGISLGFLAVDISGAAFSIVSLGFRPPPFDVLAAFNYISVLVLDLGIVLFYFVTNYWYKRSMLRRKSNTPEEGGEENQVDCTENVNGANKVEFGA